MTASPKKTHSISIFGLPNSGKSTLFNALLGHTFSVVTHKRQTTVYATPYHLTDTITLWDTPGLFIPKQEASTPVQTAMMRSAWATIGQSDIRCLVLDATITTLDGINRLLNTAPVAFDDGSFVVLLNKVDLVKKPRLLVLAQKLWDWKMFSHIFMISAKKEHGVKDVKDFFLSHSKNKEVYQNVKENILDESLAEEITRKHLLLHLHQELPYRLCVDTEQWQHKPLSITQTIHVPNQRYKGMIIGKNAEVLKRISQAARQEMQSLFPAPIQLFIRVKVSKRWEDKMVEKIQKTTL